MRLFAVLRPAALAGAALLGLTFGAVLAAEAAQRACCSRDRAVEVDAVIVLGGGSDPDGHLNHLGRARVETAVELLARGDARAIIISAGAHSGPLVAEAPLMRNYALALGADPARVILEPQSRTTLENLRFSFALGEAQGFESYAIVTSAFHLTRALALARLLGHGDAVGVSADPPWLRWGIFGRGGLLARETLAWWLNAAKAAGWLGLGAMGWTEAERGEVIL